MSLLALFSAPKPIHDARTALIQSNALASWSKLPDSEVLVFGDEAGVGELANRFGARHIAGIRRNVHGTPLISSMIELAREHSGADQLCIINADMIVMADLVQAARQVGSTLRRFLLLSRRWDLDVSEALDLSDGWESRLRRRVRSQGKLHRPAGSDLFIFPRDGYRNVPDFAVGRAGWDNWMIYRARRDGWAVVDCTPSVTVVHQNHDYGHLPGGAPHHALPESEENTRLAGGASAIRFTVLDASHVLQDGRLQRPASTWARFWRGVERLVRALFFFLPPRLLEEIARPKRWQKRLGRLRGDTPARRTSGSTEPEQKQGQRDA